MASKYKGNKLPKSKALRLLLGVSLLIGGVLGFLPILGFWMIPLGLVVLSVDFSFVRRFRRKLDVWFLRKFKKNRSKGNDL